MDIASQITVLLKPELAKSAFGQNTLKPGNILKLKILELRGDRALIDFGNFRATADIKVPVMRDQELKVRILESGRQLKMAVLKPGHRNSAEMDAVLSRGENPLEVGLKKAQTDLRQIIDQALRSQSGKSIPNSMINIFNGLNSYFESIDLKEIIAKLAPRLKAYIENSGIFLEKSLESSMTKTFGDSESMHRNRLTDLPEVKHIIGRDLKASLWTLKFLLEDRQAMQEFIAPRVLKTLNNAANSLLDNIDQQQGRAIRQMDSTEPFQSFEYLLPLKEEGQAARLKVYYRKKQKSGAKNEFRLSLLLSMERLGDLRTDFFLLDKDLTITFFVQKDSIQEIIRECFPELQELLSGLFNQILMKVMVSEKKVSGFDHDGFRDTSDRQVDLRV